MMLGGEDGSDASPPVRYGRSRFREDGGLSDQSS